MSMKEYANLLSVHYWCIHYHGLSTPDEDMDWVLTSQKNPLHLSPVYQRGLIYDNTRRWTVA